jgi:hypothetical protein
VLNSIADISRALPKDHIVTTNMLSIKLTAPLAFLRFRSAYMPKDRDINAEENKGHIYGIY